MIIKRFFFFFRWIAPPSVLYLLASRDEEWAEGRRLCIRVKIEKFTCTDIITRPCGYNAHFILRTPAANLVKTGAYTWTKSHNGALVRGINVYRGNNIIRASKARIMMRLCRRYICRVRVKNNKRDKIDFVSDPIATQSVGGLCYTHFVYAYVGICTPYNMAHANGCNKNNSFCLSMVGTRCVGTSESRERNFNF